MRIDTDEMTQGLFGFVEGGTVKNVGVVDAEIYCEQNSGVIAGQAKVNASILNCFVRDSKLKCVDFLTNGMANKNNNVAATLARDMRILAELGYAPQELTPVDMFPRTAHVECVTLFKRKSGNIL